MKNTARGATRRAVSNGGWLIWLIVCLLVMQGCSAPRRAPVESRSASASDIRSSPSTYRIKRGDTLFAIAWKADLDYRELAEWNGIAKPYRIYPGQVLRLTPPRKPIAKKQSISKRTAAESSLTKSTASKKAPVKPVRRETAAKSPVGSLHWRWPVQGRLLATFKAGDPTRKGIDISGHKSQKIYAAESGKVVYSGSGLVGYGNLIILKHDNKYLSAYGHNSKLLVKEGQQVSQGTVIAEMGQANSGQTMLHFEIRLNGKPIDPLSVLPKG